MILRSPFAGEMAYSAFMRILLQLLTLLLATGSAWAAEPEAELFAGATASFTNRFHERAEQQFAEFVQKFPNSTNLAAAILYQAQARFFQRKHDAAVELLQKETPRAGALIDHYYFWQGEALFAKGDFAGASAAYSRVPGESPQSILAPQASYLQAFSEFQQRNLTNTIELLTQPEGAFQRLAKTNAQESFAVRGQLLLADAFLALNRVEEARQAVSAIPPLANRPELEWRRQQWSARVEFAGPKPEAALPHLTNAVAAALAAQRSEDLAQTWNLEAETYRKLNLPDAAAAAYEKIVSATNAAPDPRRLALLKMVEIWSGSGRLTNAIARLESYLATNTNEPAADFLRLKTGELWIDQFRALTNASEQAAATNALQQARLHLNIILNQFTNSTHIGRTWLNLGWAGWEEGTRYNNAARVRESESYFRNAAERLTRSDEQALALFKTADAQLQTGNAAGASTNYSAVLRNFSDLPQVRSSLFDRAYRQLVRAYIELGDLANAGKIVAEYRSAFANSAAFQETFYLYGRALSREGNSESARAVFNDFLTNYPGSPLVPQARFSESRTHMLDGNLKTAVEKQEQWLAAYTNHQLRAEVEFQRALLIDQSGDRTNALRLFTNFVAQFPQHALAPAALNWVADYFYAQEQWLPAEQHYQRLFQNTNWTGSRFHFPARMMAARSAFFRQGYDDARSYLTNIIQDPKCPADLLPEAWFALGDVFVEQPIVGNTNVVHNFTEAAKVFQRIVNQFPNSRIAPLAMARRGDCHAQLAAHYPESFGVALESYRAVIAQKPPAVPVLAHNRAEVGLALLLKRSSETKPPDEKQALLKQALNHLLNVVYGTNLNGEAPDPFFLKMAGMEAGRVAEALGEDSAALELYRRLIEQAPSMRTFWEGRIASLRQRIAGVQ
jgi:TolA-binding protein